MVLGSFILNSDNLGETEEILAATFGQIRIDARTTGSATRALLWRTTVGQFNIDEAEFSYSMRFAMDPPDQVLLCRIRSGTLEERLTGSRETFRFGQAVAFGAVEGLPFAGAVHSARYDLIAVDRSLIRSVAGDDSVRLTSSTPVNYRANQLLVDTLDHLRHSVLANAQAMQEPLMAGAMLRYLAATVLSALPHTTGKSASRGNFDDSAVKLRRAMAFIDGNAHTDISVADIAIAADTTPRALRHMFRRHRDSTPTQYVRTVRLQHAHSEIRDGSGVVTSVTQVAHRWGFADAESFAAAYLEMYGCEPDVGSRRRA